MKANDIQVGGQHYKKGGEEHWDRAWRLKYDPFQYIITKWIERWREKGGVEDLKKVQHAIGKYIELVEAGDNPREIQPWWNPPAEDAKLFGPKSGGGDIGMTEVETIAFDPGGHFAAAIAKRGPEDFMRSNAVKQTGYLGFTYEGGSAEWDLFTCRKCRAEVRTAVNENPSNYHSNTACIGSGEAGTSR